MQMNVHPGQYSSGSECVLGSWQWRRRPRWRYKRRRQWRFFMFHLFLRHHRGTSFVGWRAFYRSGALRIRCGSRCPRVSRISFQLPSQPDDHYYGTVKCRGCDTLCIILYVQRRISEIIIIIIRRGQSCLIRIRLKNNKRKIISALRRVPRLNERKCILTCLLWKKGSHSS